MSTLKSPQILSYRRDARFSFALARPDDTASPLRGFVVGVHDSERQWECFLEGFGRFAIEHHFAVVVPIFTEGPLGDGNPDGYKLLIEQELRYDRILNGMLDQAAMHTSCREPVVMMHGYSGGAQFVHRYLLLHPERLAGVSIAAPGEVTLPDDSLVWWAGVGDAQSLFERPVDWGAVSQVPIHLAVGERDESTEQLSVQPPSRFWKDELERLNSNRKDRLNTLHRALSEVGAMSQLEILPGVGHSDGQQLAMARAAAFFEVALPSQHRPAAGFMARTTELNR